MQKSRIEWCEFTSNPVKGECPVGCSYCYVKSFRERYGWHKDIRFYPEELEAIQRRRKPAGIFVGSTIELFHDKTIQYMPEIMDTIRACPWHRFYLLTKQPQNLIKFSPFPENAWVGVTATNSMMAWNGYAELANITAEVKFLSLEPLLEEIDTRMLSNFIGTINWLILGAQTKPYKPPLKIWIDEITEACKKANIPYFLKDNLRPLLGDDLVQDMPIGVGIDH